MFKMFKFTAVLMLMSLIFIEIFLVLGMSKVKENRIYDDFDYIIVLGEKLNNDNMSNILIDRVDLAFNLYRKNKNAKLILTGGTIGENSISEAFAMSNFLLELGVSSNDIILENKATSTFENIKLTRELIQHENKNIALVTSDFHIPRALVISRNMGLDVVPYSSNTTLVEKTKRLVGEYPRFLVDITRSSIY